MRVQNKIGSASSNDFISDLANSQKSTLVADSGRSLGQPRKQGPTWKAGANLRGATNPVRIRSERKLRTSLKSVRSLPVGKICAKPPVSREKHHDSTNTYPITLPLSAFSAVRAVVARTEHQFSLHHLPNGQTFFCRRQAQW